MNAAKTIGRYEILEELGRGAMGSVFKARDPVVGRIVALKTILSAALGGAQSQVYQARFLREAHAAGCLAHPGIVPVFDAGEHEGIPYLVMEFVDGTTLADRLKQGERFTLDRVCEIGGQIAEALGYAHRQGVIHRDIKPANILMTSRQVYGAERPRITDFGIAKLAAGEITTTGQLLGTPSFMPPEQFTGAPIDGRADLFSLGVILYSLATGEQPFPGETMTSVSYKVVHTEPVPPSKLNPGIPAALEAIILKCLAKSPADRYQSGEELARDLDAMRANAAVGALRAIPPPRADLLDSDVMVAPRPSGADRIPADRASAKPGKRRLSTLLVAGAAAALMVGTWIVARHRREAPREIAQQARGGTTAGSAVAPVDSAQHQSAGMKPSPAKILKPSQSAPGIDLAADPANAKPAAGSAAAAVPASLPGAQVFNPKTLDPRTNAKLRIALKHVPDGLAFTIEMNGKPYLHAVAGGKGEFDDLFVPPGIQEFSLVYQSAGQVKSSNIVSNEFRPKKRRTLHIELLGETKPAMVQGGLSGDAQLFLSLK